jgi:hypothetical protein
MYLTQPRTAIVPNRNAGDKIELIASQSADVQPSLTCAAVKRS